MTTKAEKMWMDQIAQLGCIVCFLQGHPATPGAVHHLLRGGRRIGHLQTICLCDPGHHQNGGDQKISRHPDKARFEGAYGTEASLLAKSRALVIEHFGTPENPRMDGVDIDRIHHKLGAVRRA